MEQIDCPLCKKADSKKYPISGSFGLYRIVCDRCGQYLVTDEFLTVTEDDFMKNNAYLFSGLARELKETKQIEPTFKYCDKEKIFDNYLVPNRDDLDAKVLKLLERLKSCTDYYGKYVTYIPENDYPLAYAKNKNEFWSLCKLLDNLGYAQIVDETNADIFLTLTPEGWKLLSGLESKNKDSEQGFIAIWFDGKGSMNESISSIEEAIKEAEFKPMCIKDEHFSEMIMDKALGEIRESRFVVIDLTGSRPSVFFEAGFAFGLGVEAIYVYKKGEETESPLDFYVKHYQCHAYSSPEELKEIVKSAIKARINK